MISWDSFKHSKYLYILIVLSFISLFLRRSLISYCYALIGVWLIVLHNRYTKRSYYIYPFCLCLLVSLGTLVLDVLATLRIIYGNVQVDLINNV